jgi:capsular polysaccharide biosynthesis protein
MAGAQIVTTSSKYVTLLNQSQQVGAWIYEDGEEAPVLMSPDEMQNYAEHDSTLELLSSTNAASGYCSLHASNEFLNQLRIYFEQTDRKFNLVPAIACVRLHRVMHYYGTSYAVNHAHSAVADIYDMNRACDRPALANPGGIQHVAKRMSRARKISRGQPNTLLVSSAGSFNYGHWLVDDLTRVYLYFIHFASREQTIPVSSITITGYGSIIDERRKQSLRWLFNMIFSSGVNGYSRGWSHACLNRSGELRVREASFQRLTTLDSPTLVSPSSYHPTLMCQTALTGLRSVAQAYVHSIQSTEPFADRLYISRRSGRQLVNSHEIEDMLAIRGFRTLYCEEMNFDEQLHAFARAKIIVGIMGASMVNCMFAPANSKFIFLSPEHWYEPFYRTLTMNLGNQAHFIYGETITTNDEVAGMSHLKDFKIDPTILDDVLSCVQ